MALLIPHNLSSSKARRKVNKDSTKTGNDYPLSGVERHGEQSAEAEDLDELMTKAQIKPTAQQFRPVPVIGVDPLDLLDSDVYGEELGKEAKVWKVYVRETDESDREIIRDWIEALDGVLVFAALFSTVSTAFLAQSSGMLQQNPNDVSAAALLAISQTLAALTNSSLVNTPTLANANSSDFTASQHAIAVNTLWYSSLSMSIATALLAMLAKGWCQSFGGNRTGHPWEQAMRRQRKWMMIERWKMQQLIVMLPSLIHLSLLLFAIGLCIFVWDINHTVAMPTIWICGIFFAFYMWSSVVASIVAFFPYTTTTSMILRSDFVLRQYNRSRGYVAQVLLWTLTAIEPCYLVLRRAPALLAAIIYSPVLAWDFIGFIFLCSSTPPTNGYFQKLVSAVHQRIQRHFPDDFASIKIHALFTAAIKSLRSSRSNEYNLGSNMEISLALKWLIENSISENSATTALQAIAGAGPQIPLDPLESSGASRLILRRLASSAYTARTEFEAKLYMRALTVLGVHIGKQASAGGLEDFDPRDTTAILSNLKAFQESQSDSLTRNYNIPHTVNDFEALKLGSMATQLSTRLLANNCRFSEVADLHRLIFDQLIRHIHIPSEPCVPVAIQSLANAAILLTSFSEALMRPSLLEECLDSCLRPLTSGKQGHIGQITYREGVLDPRTAFIVCILFNRLTAFDGSVATPQMNIHSSRLGPQIARAALVLMDKQLLTCTAQSAFYRVAVCEAFMNLNHARPDGHSFAGSFSDFQSIYESYMKSGLLLPRTVLEGSPSLEAGDPSLQISDFIAAILRLYTFLHHPKPQETIVFVLPTPVYYTLSWIICLTASNTERTSCEQLLSRCVFPRISSTLAATVAQVLPQLWKTYKATNERFEDGPSTSIGWFPIALPWLPSNPKSLSRAIQHFAATQLWLLLYLAIVEETTPRYQPELRVVIEREISHKPIDELKTRLEQEILGSYEVGHCVGIYSARVVECVLESKGDLKDSSLSRRIRDELLDIPQGLRGLSSFSDFHPDRSAPTNIEPTLESHTTIDLI